jgi:NADPH-dependent curcumin reductase CurA
MALDHMVTSREIRLKSRPVGIPSAENFELATVSVPYPAPGQVQVHNLWMTVDPYMRGRMAQRASYAPSSQPGREGHGSAIGPIAASNSTMYGWRPSFLARISLCGMISQYNAIRLPDGPRNIMFVMGKSLRLGWRGSTSPTISISCPSSRKRCPDGYTRAR